MKTAPGGILPARSGNQGREGVRPRLTKNWPILGWFADYKILPFDVTYLQLADEKGNIAFSFIGGSATLEDGKISIDNLGGPLMGFIGTPDNPDPMARDKHKTIPGAYSDGPPFPIFQASNKAEYLERLIRFTEAVIVGNSLQIPFDSTDKNANGLISTYMLLAGLRYSDQVVDHWIPGGEKPIPEIMAAFGEENFPVSPCGRWSDPSLVTEDMLEAIFRDRWAIYQQQIEIFRTKPPGTPLPGLPGGFSFKNPLQTGQVFVINPQQFAHKNHNGPAQRVLAYVV